MKNIILSSLKESFLAVKNNKALFLALIILQLFFIGALAFVNVKYQSIMLENAQNIMAGIESMDLSDIAVSEKFLKQENIISGADALYKDYSMVIAALKALLLYSFLLLVSVNSLNWVLAGSLLNSGSNFGKMLNVWLKNVIISAICLAAIGILGYAAVQRLFSNALAADVEASTASFIPLLAIAALLIYFMFVSLALSSNTTWLVGLPRKALSISARKAHVVIAAMLINFICVAAIIAAAYFFIERNVALLFILMMLGAAAMVWSRVFFITVVNKAAQRAKTYRK